MFIGFTPNGRLSKKRNIYWEAQIFAFIRSFKDGITFLNFKLNYDRYESEHSPAFQVELTILNLYFHLWIYKDNTNSIESTGVSTNQNYIDPEIYENLCNEVKQWRITPEVLDELAFQQLVINEDMTLTESYYTAYFELKKLNN